MSQIGKYLDETLNKFSISGKAIAEASGFTQAFISAIKSGKSNPSSEGLLTILDGLEKIKPESRWYFCELLSGRNGRPMQQHDYEVFNETVEELNQLKMAKTIIAIGRKLRNEARTNLNKAE